MMNSKIMMSGLSIMTALTLMAGSAYAAFVAQAQSTGNTFSTGVADLQISSDNVTYGANIPAFFSGSGFFPGDSRNYTFYLKNNSASGVTLNVDAAFTNGSGDGALQNALMTDFACNNTADPAAFSVSSMLGGSVDLGDIPSGGVVVCTLNVSLPTSADNSVANKTVGFDGIFNATQVTAP